jgi:hypothetical protein
MRRDIDEKKREKTKPILARSPMLLFAIKPSFPRTAISSDSTATKAQKRKGK